METKFKKYHLETQKLLFEHGLFDWSVEFINTKTSYGTCKYNKKIIGLNKHHLENGEHEQIMNTIYHEIAHAITQSGHDIKWRNMFKKLGGDGNRQSSHGTLPKGKIKYVCPKCNELTRTHRRFRRRYSCKLCCNKHNNGLFSDKYLLKEVL